MRGGYIPFRKEMDYNSNMLDSAIQVLSQYSKVPLSHYTFRRFEIVRLDVEDFLYLCNVGDAWYVVYGSDYIDNLPGIASEALDIFGDDFTLLHWLPRTDTKSEPVPLGQRNDISADEIKPKWYKPLISELPGNYLRYAVIEAKPKFKAEPQADPLAYGGSKL